MRTAFFVTFAWIAIAAGRGYGLDITDCGQVVPEGQVGVLQADIAGCHIAVTLEDHASLQLNDHSITECSIGAVQCLESCTVTGPGTLASSNYGIFGSYLHKHVVTADGIVFHDNLEALSGLYSKFVLSNLVVTGNGGPSGNYDPQHSPAIIGRSLLGTNLQVTDNHGPGTAMDRTTKLIDSVLTGNNGEGKGIDIESRMRPRVTNTVCGHSLGFQRYPRPWRHTCANDP